MNSEEQKRPVFIPGLDLAERFFHEEIKPVLNSHFPDLKYSAALIGAGSEVLGFDTEMSTDHQWGPRGMIFLHPASFNLKHDEIKTTLSNKLPYSFLGYPTSFTEPNPEDHGTQLLKPVTQGPVNHMVYIYSLDGYFSDYMNIDIKMELSPIDWLTIPQQKLRAVTAGRVFHDDIGLEAVRKRFAWYPRDVWLYILASGWKRIAQEEHMMGRAGYVGDEIGSALMGSRLVRDIMRLVFYMEKQYPPYSKWFGTAFSLLQSADKFQPFLMNALRAKSWKEREEHLCIAYENLAEMHNALNITEFIAPKVKQFFGRPFMIIESERFVKAIGDQIKDQQLQLLLKQRTIGSVDIITDNTNVLDDISLRPALGSLYK